VATINPFNAVTTIKGNEKARAFQSSARSSEALPPRETKLIRAIERYYLPVQCPRKPFGDIDECVGVSRRSMPGIHSKLPRPAER
jgi:hypothetical protein